MNWDLGFSRRAFEAAARFATQLLPSPPPITIHYGPLTDQVGDLYLPPNAETPLPTVVLLHGGYWQAPYTRSLMQPTAKDLCASGVAVLNLEYRRCGRGGGGGGFPNTLTDVSRGIDWLMSEEARNTYGLDPSRVAIVGHSAGGHLALWSMLRESLPKRAGGADGNNELESIAAAEADSLLTALADSGLPGTRLVRPRCVISAGGVTDLAFAFSDARQQRLARPAVESLLLSDGLADRAILMARLQLASPAAMLPEREVTERDLGLGDNLAGLAGLTLIHGLNDDIVPPDHSTRFFEAAAKAGVGCTYRQVKREGHFEVLQPTSASWAAVRTTLQQAGVLPGVVAGGTQMEARMNTSVAVALPAGTRTETLDEAVFVTRRAGDNKGLK